MENQIVKYSYNEQEVEFNLQNKNVMVNATEMAKVFGKRVDVFLKSDHAKEFIDAVKFTPYGVNLGIKNEEDLIQTRGRNGTFMHRLLAIKFAAWLDPKFEVWVYWKIDELLFGDALKRKELIIEKSKEQLQHEQLKQKWIEKMEQDPDYIAFNNSKLKIKQVNTDLREQDKKAVQMQLELLSNTQ